MNKAYEEQIEEEIERKIELMESENYEFPKRFSSKDYIVTVVIVMVCLGVVIAGAFI